MAHAQATTQLDPRPSPTDGPGLGEVTPSACYDVCQNAFTVLQQNGGLTPTLCAATGPFAEYAQSCSSCYRQNGATLNSSSGVGQAIAYCAGDLPSSVPSSAVGSSPAATTNTARTSYTIPTSWLTHSTTLSVSTFTGLIEHGTTTNRVYTLVVDVVVTRSDWTGFRTATASTGRAPPPTSTGSRGGESNSGGSQAWIAGPVIGGVVGLAAIAAATYFLLRRRRCRKQNIIDHDHPQETWDGKPELHADDLPGPPKPFEVSGDSRLPQELDGSAKYYGHQQRPSEGWGTAELAANETAAREMHVKSGSQEMEGEGHILLGQGHNQQGQGQGHPGGGV
ncbi:uncharacterized protein C8A04DRAFT_24224 [Dichotomopilus funicola]|uniref:Uncharacterized protein n=1 Tax=Dichotomopilus funicola TaxID=1934379 RepID=A0AAN6VA71_9PEZI|nr:hypothetical protein C8A04DRAFT_24224 [Dichotomopilus funicola]